MLPFIIGGVTIAAVGYAIKEICEEEGCPWEDSTSSEKNRDKEQKSDNTKDFFWGYYETDSSSSKQELKNSKISKEFHKVKKSIYKTSMQMYQEFLVKYEIDDKYILPIDNKLKKQKLSDDLISDELDSYIKQITSTLEILSHNLSLGIQVLQNKENSQEYDVENLYDYAQSIYDLSHLMLLDEWQNLNQVEILSTLVKAMKQVTNKDTIYVDLAVK